MLEPTPHARREPAPASSLASTHVPAQTQLSPPPVLLREGEFKLDLVIHGKGLKMTQFSRADMVKNCRNISSTECAAEIETNSKLTVIWLHLHLALRYNKRDSQA